MVVQTSKQLPRNFVCALFLETIYHIDAVREKWIQTGEIANVVLAIAVSIEN